MNAVLYLRFSTSEQADGDSERRQTEMAEKWCRENGHTLAAKYADRGISGAKGTADRKELARMMAAIERGEPIAFVLVEDVDRLSRDLPIEASKLIERIVSKGVSIINLRDDSKLNKDNWQTTGVWMVLQLKTALASEEREKRKSRGKAAWEEKRRNASAEIYTKKTPSWIIVDAGNMKVDEAKATTVRKIYSLANEGYGIVSIIRKLNADGVIPFRVGARWNKSIIHNILTSVAVVGRFQPRTSKEIRHENGKIEKKRIPEGPELKGYFPSIIDEGLFYSVQSKLKQRNKYRGSGVKRNPANSNLFAGIIKCSKCGNSMITLVRAKRKRYVYLVCSKAHKEKKCSYKVVSSRIIETCFHIFLQSNHFFSKYEKPVSKASSIEAEIGRCDDEIDKIMKLIEKMTDPPKTLVAKLSELEKKGQELEGKLLIARTEDQALSVVPDVYDEFIERMVNDLEDVDGRVRITNLVREVVERIVVDTNLRTIWVSWRHVNQSEGLKWSEDGNWFCRIDVNGKAISQQYCIAEYIAE